jgi:hypothetical protein
VRQLAGVLVKDVPRYAGLLMRSRTSDYLRLCNRAERLEAAPDGKGYRCDWQWTSDLHAPQHMPFLGRWIVARALAEHPFAFASAPAAGTAEPEISFIIGHRGTQRLPLLLQTLRSVAALTDARIECLVVEQDAAPELRGQLPSWVRHIVTRPPSADMPYCRSWAFNVGAKEARGRILVLHDNDMLVPCDYAKALLSHFDAGFEVVNVKRFIFYLSQAHTAAFLAGQAGLGDAAPLAITQNLEAGGSVAITREAYTRIGGMDESFVGWGGEDNEFWERAAGLRVWPYGYLPIVHLWHAAQPGKQAPDSPTLRHYQAQSALPAAQRIARLKEQTGGQASGPAGWRTGDEQ